jgi:phosphohistidine phosphatase
MLLYVMRHGPAEDHAPSGRDFDRALTPDGREVVARAARAFHDERHALAARPWRILSSPFRRARQTAEIMAAATPDGLSTMGPRAAPNPGLLRSPAPEVELHGDLAADAGLPLRLVGELAGAGTDALLVAHQPVVEELVRELLRPLPVPLPSGFRTATILALERVAPDRWRPAAVLDPYRLAP